MCKTPEVKNWPFRGSLGGLDFSSSPWWWRLSPRLFAHLPHIKPWGRDQKDRSTNFCMGYLGLWHNNAHMHTTHFWWKEPHTTHNAEMFKTQRFIRNENLLQKLGERDNKWQNVTEWFLWQKSPKYPPFTFKGSMWPSKGTIASPGDLLFLTANPPSGALRQTPLHR